MPNNYRPSTSTEYNLIGTGLNEDKMVEPPKPRGLPRASAAGEPSQPPAQEPQAAPAPQSPQFEEVDASQYDMSTVDAYEELPDYANGASPLTPVNSSPLSLQDRLKLSVGNKAGTLNYLKQRYEDVTLDKSGAFVVKDQGIWHRVDPLGLGDGDPWERTKELVADFADLGDVALLTAGQIGGAAVGGLAASPTVAGVPAGAIAGGVAGATAAAGLKSRLGRLVGTYSATPEEEIKDAALEGVLALGGETVALGAKVGMKAIKSAFSRISEVGANQSKEFLSAAMSQGYGYPRSSYRRAMDDPSVLSLADDIIKRGGRSADINKLNQIVSSEQTSLIEKMAEEAPKSLKREFDQSVKKIESIVPKDWSVDLAGTVKDIGTKLSSAGLMKVEQKGKKQLFSVYSPEELAKQFGTEVEQLPKILSPEMLRNMEMVAKTINTYSSLPKVNGKMATRKLLEVKNAMNDVFSELIDRAPEGTRLRALGAEMKNTSNEVFAQKFADAGPGVGEQYLAMNKRYSELADSAKMLSQIRNTPTLQREGMVKALVKKLSDQTGSYKQLQGEAKALSDLMRSPTGDPIQRLLDLEASSAFLDMVPKNLGGNSLTTAIRGATALTGGPRTASRMIKTAKYTGKFADFAKSLGPKQSAQLLQNPAALRAALDSITEGVRSEEQNEQQLLQGAVENAKQQQ